MGDELQVIPRFNLECHISWISDLISKFLIHDKDIKGKDKRDTIFSPNFVEETALFFAKHSSRIRPPKGARQCHCSHLGIPFGAEE